MTRSLVTGGGGFIGSHLVDALLELGHEVRVLDNFATGDRRNLMHVRREVEVLEGELRSYERVHAAVRDCDLVFHLGALPSVPRSIGDPLTSSDVNVTGTLNVLLAARDAGVRRIINASSSSVYGRAAGDAKREDQLTRPLSPYGVSKLAAEAYCSSFYHAYGIETVSLRYFNVFGPRQSPISEYAAVVPSFIAAILLDEQPIVYGDGMQSRDFTYVANVVDANLRAAATPEAAGEIVNVGCGDSSPVLGVLDTLAEISGREVVPKHAAARVGEVRSSKANIDKAASVLGYAPRVCVSEGLRLTYAHFVIDERLLPLIHERRKWLAVAS
jgi:UDP-glucose 4-epimerase